jgi:hypothetical protein
MSLTSDVSALTRLDISKSEKRAGVWLTKVEDGFCQFGGPTKSKSSSKCTFWGGSFSRFGLSRAGSHLPFPKYELLLPGRCTEEPKTPTFPIGMCLFVISLEAPVG